ncbi:multidrug DMT transporter permease [Jannaschia pagri]|uniref:Multidrug DMT transporter permease n=1 Tax=Jannaschia pagri TaxID=2829797 RepID=A0ABQ4NNZ3_9RHOB|nr:MULTISPECIES: DMT family transporter [unclassified Jannaschia]GIT92290.1 multidrug DMT transporter permease [Jannaschia sp. AI_61]GIT96125.1 multidrug DMT transporter permease [Jannaschia sp. AI_62]
MSAPRPVLWGSLLLFGAGWGLLQPFNKVAVAGGFQPFAIMVWQAVVTLVLGAVLLRRLQIPFPPQAAWLLCVQVAILGTLLPHLATYTAVAHLPAGLMAILIATIPILALPIGALFGVEVVTLRRVAGLCLGMAAVALIALAQGHLAGGAPWAVAVALCAPLCYAVNAALIVRNGTGDVNPLAILWGAMVLVLPLSLGLALVSDQPLSLFDEGRVAASLAVLLIAVVHTLVYSGFLWLLGQAGAVFAGQTAYLVTGFGVLWSALLLGERYPASVLVAGVLMVLGMALVRPVRPNP